MEDIPCNRLGKRATLRGCNYLDIKRVGKTIAFFRKRAGLTQKELGNRIGISDKAVSKWERGLGLPDISYLTKLAIILDTDPESILTGDMLHHDKGWNGLLMLTHNPCISASTMIYSKPIVYYLLSYFLLVGIRNITVVSNKHDREYLISEFGDGSRLNICIRYCEDEQGAIQHEIDYAMDCSNIMVVYDRVFLYGVGLTRAFQRAMLQKNHLTVLSLPKKVNDGFNGLKFDDNRKTVNSYSEVTIQTQYEYYEIPILFSPLEILKQICCKKENLINLSDNFLRNELLYTEPLDLGYIGTTVNTLNDVIDVSNFVRLVEETSGMLIYCVEEIAWRRGMISLDEFKSLGQDKVYNEYGKYILDLSDQYSTS